MVEQEGEARFTDWRYMTEGGRHVIFCRDHISLAKGRDPPVGCRSLLRCRKEDLVSAMMQSDDQCEAHSSQRKTQKLQSADFDHVRDLIYPSLAPFVDLPDFTWIDREMAQSLFRRATESGKIPLHRQKDWELPKMDVKSSAEFVKDIQATLMPDYRYPFVPPPPPSHETTHSCWAFEFKPKAGYISYSPFVDPRHRVKFSDCRFRLMQGYKQSPSMYNPLDFFSGDINRIRQSLQDLIQCPQNNLRIWKYHEETGLSSVDPGELSEARLDDAFHELLSADDDRGRRDSITEAVAHILHREDFLSRLLALQKLDWIDADGAIVLYEILKSKLPSKSVADIHALIDNIYGVPNEKEAARRFHTMSNKLATQMIRSNPTPLPDSCGAPLMNLIDFITRFRSESCRKQRLSSFDLEEVHADCIRMAESLNVDEIIYLLRTWLLSLAMCDVSFFVSLQAVPSFSTIESYLQSNKQQREGNEAWGLVALANASFFYQIKVVDCDAKPASKLATRRKKEEIFNRVGTIRTVA